MPDQKEPMIGKESRPSAIDYNAPVAGMKFGELVAALGANLPEHTKAFYEFWKPEYFKPEFWKPEFWKPEYFKPEVTKPPAEKEFQGGGVSEQFLERVTTRVVEALKQRGAIK